MENNDTEYGWTSNNKLKRKSRSAKRIVKEGKIILMNLTETWLDNTIKDVVEIEGYNIFRGERKNRERGGTAIYIHDKIEANLICEMSNGTCDMVAVRIPDIQTINIVIYRPPGTKSQEFNPILSEIQKNLPKSQKNRSNHNTKWRPKFSICRLIQMQLLMINNNLKICLRYVITNVCSKLLKSRLERKTP